MTENYTFTHGFTDSYDITHEAAVIQIGYVSCSSITREGYNGPSDPSGNEETISNSVNLEAQAQYWTNQAAKDEGKSSLTLQKPDGSMLSWSLEERGDLALVELVEQKIKEAYPAA